MRAVNLLPREAARSWRLRRDGPALLAVAVAALAALALAAGFLSAHAKASSARKDLAAARAELARTRADAPRLDAIARVLAGRAAWDRVVGEVALALPADVTLTGLTLGADRSVALAGRARSPRAVLELLARLARVPELERVALARSRAERRSVRFEIRAAVKGTAP